MSDQEQNILNEVALHWWVRAVPSFPDADESPTLKEFVTYFVIRKVGKTLPENIPWPLVLIDPKMFCMKQIICQF